MLTNRPSRPDYYPDQLQAEWRNGAIALCLFDNGLAIAHHSDRGMKTIEGVNCISFLRRRGDRQ